MTKQNEEWLELSRMWVEVGADGPEEAVNAELVATIRRRALLARLNAVGEILVCVVAIGILVWAVAVHQLTGLPVIAAFAFILSAIAMSIWSRWQKPDFLMETQGQALRTAAAQARSGQRWAWAGLAVCAAGSIYMAVFLLQMTSAKGQTLMAVGAAGTAFVLVWICLCVRHARTSSQRLRAYLEAIEALESEAVQE